MNEATYNCTSDRLKVWFDERLPKAEYDEFRALGFVFWHGSKCLTRVWTPEAEDLIKRHGVEIEADDSPDDTEARVERFSRYAERHEARAEGAESYMQGPGCNTERRRRNAVNAMEKGFDAAAYWNRRIEASIRHANFKESPGLIMRRIDELESQLRRHERMLTQPEESTGDHKRLGDGRCGRWVHQDKISEVQDRARRWVDHINMRLTYERAMLAATDSVQARLASNEVQIEVGGAVEASSFYGGDGWYFVTKVNEKTIETWKPGRYDRQFHKFERSTIKGVASKVQVDAGEVSCEKPGAELMEQIFGPKKIEKATNRAGERPEKWGAIGVCPGFSMKEEEAEWMLIIKVNAKTLDFVYEHTEQVLTGGKLETRKRLLKKSESIHSARFLKTAEQAAQIPALVAMKARIEAIEAKKKERKAAEKAEKGAEE